MGAQTSSCALKPSGSLTMSIVQMGKITAFLDDRMKHAVTLRLDSGAAISCISEAALREHKHHLLLHGKLHQLLTPITLSGFASVHTRVTKAIEGARFIIGRASCTQNLQAVSNLVCDYLIGQDFMMAYDMRQKLVDRKVSMVIPMED